LEEDIMMNGQSSAVLAEPQARWPTQWSDRAHTASTTDVQPKREVQGGPDSKLDTVIVKMDSDCVLFAVQSALSTDSSVHAGQLLSDDVMEREKLLLMIFKSISRFAAEKDPAYRISPDTAKAAVRFFNALGTRGVLPKIVPDGEDALMAVWDDSDGTLAVILENDRLHMVANAGTTNAQYFDDLPFDGTELPDQVRKLIPNP
jgi:hypothetical protein